MTIGTEAALVSPGGPETVEFLEVEGIHKRFGPVVANIGVNARFQYGHIHALLGENGAGKSTLIKILSGIYEADSGQIRIGGQTHEIHSTADAKRLGIAVVHQHSSLIDRLSVAENIALVSDGLGFLKREVIAQFARTASSLGFAIDPKRSVGSLSMGDRQRVEIIRAMMTQARVLILDEPTATLAPNERVELFALLRKLADTGSAVILVTHRLDEATRYCDAVTILRAGMTVFESQDPRGLTPGDLVLAMVGDVRLDVESRAVVRGPRLLEVSQVRTHCPDSTRFLSVDNLSVASGEIHAVAGVEGNGQSDLAGLLTGAWSPDEGTVTLEGKQIASLNAAVRSEKVAHVPDDESLGFSVKLRVWENLFTEQMLYRRAPSAKTRHAMRGQAAQLVARYNIQPPSVDAVGGQLSGGNRRRVQIAREFSKTAVLVVCNYATKGLDVQSIQQVKNWCRELANSGAAVVYIASDLDEMLEIADSVSVLSRGRLSETRRTSEATSDWLGHLMLATDDGDESSR